jgi:hypothetical protein
VIRKLPLTPRRPFQWVESGYVIAAILIYVVVFGFWRTA